MTEVYGFDDSKSKVQIVDEESQSTKDAEQDASITGKGISDIVATVDGDNLAVTVKQADGTSKSGSVTLPAGGEIEVEEYGVPEVSTTLTFSTSVTIGTTVSGGSGNLYVLKLTAGDSNTALYYDKVNNCLKKCMVTEFTTGYSGTYQLTKYTTNVGTTNEAYLREALDPYVLGMRVSPMSSTAKYLRLLIGSYVIVTLTLTLTDMVITDYTISAVWATSASTSKTIPAGSQTVSVIYDSTSCSYPNPSQIVSTYTKIIDL